MPLVYVTGRLVHFAHVPRCGGTSVENYLHARFGPLALIDRGHFTVEKAQRWSKSSPQHLELAAFNRIIPRSWVAHRFALVRHPEDRIISVFLFQRDIEGTIEPDTRFTEWLASLEGLGRTEPHALDNHPRPAADLVPKDAIVFRLEDGMEPVVDWLDGLEGAKRGPRKIQQANEYSARLEQAGREPGPPPAVTPEARAMIARIYSEDFHRFGYTARDDTVRDATADAAANEKGKEQ